MKKDCDAAMCLFKVGDRFVFNYHTGEEVNILILKVSFNQASASNNYELLFTNKDKNNAAYVISDSTIVFDSFYVKNKKDNIVCLTRIDI